MDLTLFLRKRPQYKDKLKVEIEGSYILRDILRELCAMCTVGNTAEMLDSKGSEMFEKYSAISAPEKDYDFPGSVCVSVNEFCCHVSGRVDNVVFKHGDVVKVDVSFFYLDRYFDSARTVVVLDPNKDITSQIVEHINLVGYTAQCVDMTMQIIQMKMDAGHKVDYSEIGRVFHGNFIKNTCYAVTKEYGGHGVGFHKLHAQPFISSYTRQDTNKNITNGDRFCVEPIVSIRSDKNKDYISHVIEGEWNVKNVDGSWSAHHENIYVVVDGQIINLMA